MNNLYTEYWALSDLLDVAEAAILAGDWQVDGACDPDAAIRRAQVVIRGHTEEVS